MKIISFGASYSKTSINKQFAHYTAQQFENADLELLDLTHFPLPLFTTDVEAEMGIPEPAKTFLSKIKSADLIIISLAEHNGTYAAAFKNLFDWVSRVELKMFAGKKLFLLSTAPGPRGGLGVMEAALSRFPLHGAEILEHFSLPKFQENFSAEKGVITVDLKAIYEEKIALVKSAF